MGVWGFNVMESDDAMDIQANLEDIASIDFEEDSSCVKRTKLEAALPKILTTLRANLSKEPEYREAMQYQVLAVMLMREGCAMEEDARQEILKNAVRCPEYEGVAEIKSKITKVRANFIEALRSESDPNAAKGFRRIAADYPDALKMAEEGSSDPTLNALDVLPYWAPDAWGPQKLAERFNGRYAALQTLSSTLSAYDIKGGIPAEVPHVGLLEKWAIEKMS